jgi:hypothetical protein
MTSTEVALPAELVNVETGERLPATVENAATVLEAARTMKERLNDVIHDATLWLVSLSAERGTQTFHAGDVTLSLSGGSGVDYDATLLVEALLAADCPEDRINEAVVTTFSYKVNRSVLKQLAAANPDYAAAIELAEMAVERPYRASVK